MWRAATWQGKGESSGATRGYALKAYGAAVMNGVGVSNIFFEYGIEIDIVS